MIHKHLRISSQQSLPSGELALTLLKPARPAKVRQEELRHQSARNKPIEMFWAF
jgi:hypothetical protein